MKWTSTKISEITTYNPIYFSSKYFETCKKICNVLQIDCFPILNEKSYYKLEKNEWVKRNILYDITEIRSVFDKKLIELFSQNDSNIVFVFNNDIINGVIHFSNYETPCVYSNIYHNLNEFEKNLRSHLFENGLTDNMILEYYKEYKLIKEKNKERIEKRISVLNRDSNKRPFENTYLRELIEFSTSKFHNKETLKKLGTSFFKKRIDNKKEYFGNNYTEIISNLRNFIMHHDNISGETAFVLHDFSKFRKFFNSVNVFKESFELLSKERTKQKLSKLLLLSEKRLELTKGLNDSQIKDYYYD